MNDEVIMKMAEAATSILEHAMGPSRVDNLIPSYNQLISAAQLNHPEDPFLSKLSPIETSASASEIAVMYAQLRLALEAASVGA